MLNTGRLMVWYYRENYYSNESESFNWPEHLNNPAHGAAAWNAKFKVPEWFLCFSRDSLWQGWQEEQSPPSAQSPPHHISHPVSTEICGDYVIVFGVFFVFFVSKSWQRWTNIRHNQKLRSEVAVFFSTGDNEQKGRDSSPLCVCVNLVFVVNLNTSSLNH